MMAKGTRCVYNNVWPKRSMRGVYESATTVLIYDRKLDSVSRDFKKWSRGFERRYSVESGETLKDLDTFATHVRHLTKLAGEIAPRELTILAVGGGSVGDFAGFFASVYKRGVRLVHMPSTWLSAIDSAHGGKTALNVHGVKNQIGSFHSASVVLLVKPLLFSQPRERVQDAMGELGKIALIDHGPWVKKLTKSHLRGAPLLWAYLKDAIRAKMKIVSRDPFEQSGIRQILNLGHTMGHVFESAFKWSHGESVAQGLFFALEFSERQGLLKPEDTDRALEILAEQLGLSPIRATHLLTKKQAEALLLQDKKKTSKKEVTFIFLRGLGRPERKNVKVSALLHEAQRQGWVGA